MATSQMTAAATSGRYMSDLVKSVSPALKLMNVLTTATDASEMPVAAGIPSSRTRPDVCRMNSRVDSAPPALAAPAGTDASLLVTGLPPATASPRRGMPKPGRQDALPAQTAPQADLMVRPGHEIVNTSEHMALRADKGRTQIRKRPACGARGPPPLSIGGRGPQAPLPARNPAKTPYQP